MDYSYALKMYRLGNELRNRERIFSEQYQLTGIDALTITVRNGILSKMLFSEPIPKSLFNAYQDERTPFCSEKSKRKILSHIDEMGQDDLQSSVSAAVELYDPPDQPGDSSYYQEALGLYRMGLKNELLIDGGRMVKRPSAISSW